MDSQAQDYEVSDAELPRPKVLLVDDLAANLQVMRGLLSKLDCDVVLAQTGEQALAAAAEHDFALVISDVHMPEMDGFQLATTLSGDPGTKDIPIVLATATYGSEVSEIGYKAGAVDYLVKPIDPFILRSKVQVFLDLYRSRLRLQRLLDVLNERNRQLKVEIAERERAEAKVRYQACHDPLTDLPNRLLFMQQLEAQAERSRNDGHSFALLYLDMNRFKPVNDQYGHQAGDALLKAIADRLLANLRKGDMVARLGGDEFAVMLEQVHDIENAERVASSLEEQMSKVFDISLDAGQLVSVSIGASVGVAIFPGDADSVDGLIRTADARMYQHKRGGKPASE